MKIKDWTKINRNELWSHQLNLEYDHINRSYKLKLTRPHIRIIDVSSYFGQWDPLLREIKISQSLITNHSWRIILEILKHEMAHQLVTDRGYTECGHGPIFKNFCDQMGVDERFQKAQAKIPFAAIDFESTQNFMESSEEFGESRRLLEKIEKLLSLAQSSNKHEALSAMEKVNELYEKYNFDRIQQQNNKNNYKYIAIDLQSSKTKSYFSVISSILIEHFFVDIVHSSIYNPLTNKKNKTLEIFGTTENLVVAEYVFHFLKRVIEELWEAHAKANQLDSKFKRSFQLGLLHGFNAKLRSSKENRLKHFQNLEMRKSLALIRNDPGLKQFINSRFPRLYTNKSNTGRVYSSVFTKGVEDGHNIVINKGIDKSSNSSPTKFLLKF